MIIQCIFAFAKWACDRLTENANFGKKKIIVSDDAHFDLGGFVNKQNCHIWGTEHPHVPKTSDCLVRILVQSHNLTNEQGVDVTVNGYHYRVMLNEFLFTKIEEADIGNI